MQVPYREKCVKMRLYRDTYSQNWAMKVHYEATVRILFSFYKSNENLTQHHFTYTHNICRCNLLVARHR